MDSPLTRLGRFAVVALSAILLTAGCASMNVSAYVERGIDIRQYHTYNWGPPDTFSTGDARLDNNRFFDERIRAQVERGLASRGFQQATSGTPDLLVHYHASVTQEIDVRNIDREYAYCDDADCRPYVYDAGTLFVDLVDPRSTKLVWRGWAEGSMDGVVDDQEWLEARIDEAVARILERLPRGL
jgi:hypothetical protein